MINQLDLFDEVLIKKIFRREKKIRYLEKELDWLEQVYEMKHHKKFDHRKESKQLDMFAS